MLGLGLGLSKMRALLSSAASIITQNLQLWLDFEKSEVVGAEQVVNGGFDSSSNWNLNSNWSIANGLASTDGTSNTDANQGFTAVIGNSYEITIDIKNISQGSYRGSVGNSKTPYFTSVGVHSFVVVATSNDRIRIQGGNNPIGDLELISVKEISQFVEDKSTNTNNAKLFTGKAMSFDGVNDEVTIPNQALSGEFTTAIWFNTNSDTDNSLYGTSHSSCIRVRPNLPIPTIELRLGAIFSFEFSSFANQWSRLVMTRDSSDTIRCYINGVESTSGTTINSGIFNINSIGHPQNGWQYTGFASDFQIYNKAWDSDDVAFDYNNPNHLVIDNPDSTLNKFNLKAYYPLCEGDGAIAYDYAPAFGDEEVVNGDFSNGSTDWDLRGLTTIINEVAGVDCPSTSYFLIQNSVMTAGLTYILTFDLTVDSGVMYNYSTYSPIQRSASGTYTETFVASSANLAFRSIGSFVGTMDNISVKEVLNPNHGTSYDGNGLDGANDVHDNDGTIYGATYVDKQPTIPQLGLMDWSKGSNEITYSEEFDNSDWAKGELTVTQNSTANYLGVVTADTLTPSSVDSEHYIESNAMTKTNLDVKSTVYVKPNGYTKVRVWNYYLSNQYAYAEYDLTGNGSLITSAGSNIAVTNTSIELVNDGWYKISISSLKGTSTYAYKTRISILNSDGDLSYIGDAISGIYVWGGHLRNTIKGGNYILTDGAAAIDVTTIQNPNNKGFDILSNPLRLREHGFNLDGSGYGEVADDDSLDGDANGDFYIQGWVKPNTLASNDRIITKGVTGNGEWMVSIGSNLGVRVFAKDVNGNAKDASNAFGALTLDAWQMITIVINRSDNEINYYLNDDSIQTFSGGATWTGLINNSNSVTIGVNQSIAGFFDGLIDEPKIYKGKPTFKEVKQNYKSGINKHKATSSFSDDFSSDYGL